MSSFVWIALASGVGGLLGYLVARTRAGGDTAALHAGLAAARTSLAERSEALRTATERAASAEGSSATAHRQLSVMEERLKAERQAAAEKLAILEQAKAALSDSFKALSADALHTNRDAFLKLAQESFQKLHGQSVSELEKREAAVKVLVAPIEKSLEKMGDHLKTLETARETAYTEVKLQIAALAQGQDKLGRETSNLVKALRTPNVRGRWGEIQLKRVVELAGMLEYCDFGSQETVSTADGRLRPDLVVRLPGGKRIVVDSKAPLQAYLEAHEAPDDALRIEKLAEHARQVRGHITQLGSKGYWSQFEPAPEFVVMFLPGEAFFSAALESDPGLIEFGVNAQVVPASPTTLISLLKAVAYGWRQEKLAENARAISALGKELHERLAIMSQHVARVGSSLGTAVDHYNKAIGSLEGRVLVSARKFRELGAVPESDSIETVEPVSQIARAVNVPELTQAIDLDPGEPPSKLSN